MDSAPSWTEIVIAATGVAISWFAYRASNASIDSSAFCSFIEMSDRVDAMTYQTPELSKELLVSAQLNLIDYMSGYILQNRRKKYVFFGGSGFLYDHLLDQITSRYALIKKDPDFAAIIKEIQAQHDPYKSLIKLREKQPKAFLDAMQEWETT